MWRGFIFTGNDTFGGVLVECAVWFTVCLFISSPKIIGLKVKIIWYIYYVY